MPDDILERLTSSLGDRYRVEKRVGQGGMATVYLAEDLKHGRRVAIKVLRPELSAALGAERFLREIELAAKLQHPHIIPLYDSGDADGVLYYVMPYIEGESLRDLLKREGRISLFRAAEIVREASSGLAFAHARGIVHRDIKPENIMLSDGHAVIADFGIARAVDASRSADANLTGAGMALGTPAYMSPEQATADAVDARSDQYALACVFYEMVSGRQAFSGNSMQAMLTSILTGPRPKLTAADIGLIPAAVDAATQRALSIDPDRRFPDITAFSKAVASESSGAAAATRESRRWRRLAIALPLLVAVAAVAWVATSNRSTRMVVSGAETIAVVPFSTSGPGLEGISEGMVDLLSSSLDGVGGVRTIEARTVVRDWRRRVGSGSGSLDDAIAVARSTSAASVITGSVVASGGTARLTAELHGLDGIVMAQGQVSGPTDSVLALADGLALELLRGIWRSREPLPSARTSAIASASIPAIRAYLVGERHHRRGQWDSAQIAFETAVDADSTFALAWYRLASTLGWKGQYQHIGAITAAANAEKYSTSLSPRLRSLFAAYNLFSQSDPAAIDSATAYTSRYGDDADGWFLLGEAQYHTRSSMPMSPTRLRAPFDRVLELDSSLSPAAIHPIELALIDRDTALINRYAAVFRRAGADGEIQRLDRVREVLGGDLPELAGLLGTSGGAGIAIATLEGMARAPGTTGDYLIGLFDTIATAAAATGSGAQQQQFQIMRAVIRVAVGRRSDAIDLVRQSETLRTGDGGMMVMMGPILAGYADSATLVEAERQLAQMPQNMYVLAWRGLAALDRKESERVVELVQPLADSDTISRWMRGTAGMLVALATVARGDTVGGLIRADSAIRLIGGTTVTAFTMPVLLRYAELEVTRPVLRQRGIDRLRYGFPNAPELVPLNTLRLARAYEGAGIFDSAHVNYARFLGYWDQPDPQFASIVADARAALQRTAPDATAAERSISNE